MSAPQPDAADVASGLARAGRADPERVAFLRFCFRAFAHQQTTSPRLRGVVEDMLAGRAKVTDLICDPEFDRIVSERLANVEKGVAALTDEQRSELAARRDGRVADSSLAALIRRADPQAARLADRDERAAGRGDPDDLTERFRARHRARRPRS